MELKDRVIEKYKYWDLCLNNDQYYLGSVYLWAKRDGDYDMLDMTDEEHEEFFDVSRQVKKSLIKSFNPDRFNYANLQNKAHHLHIHIIPRYKESRKIEKVKFTDEHWGGCFYPYDEEFSIGDDVYKEIIQRIRTNL